MPVIILKYALRDFPTTMYAPHMQDFILQLISWKFSHYFLHNPADRENIEAKYNHLGRDNKLLPHEGFE